MLVFSWSEHFFIRLFWSLFVFMMQLSMVVVFVVFVFLINYCLFIRLL